MCKSVLLLSGILIAVAGVCAPASSRAAVLYDNGPLVNSPGTGAGGADESVLQRTALGMFILGFGIQSNAGNRVADEFTIDDPGGWEVRTITVYACQTNSGTTSTMNEINVRIWDGPPGDPASTIVFGDDSTYRLTSTFRTNIYRTDDTTDAGGTAKPVMAIVADAAVVLDQGTYWLDWQAGGSLPSGPWAPPVTIVGQASTGNGMIHSGGVWSLALDTGTNTVQGFPFIVEGAINLLPPTPTPIPTASNWGMFVLAVVLALASFAKIRRFRL